MSEHVYKTREAAEAAQAQHDKVVRVVADALLNISEAGEFFKSASDPARAKADYIVLSLKRAGYLTD